MQDQPEFRPFDKGDIGCYARARNALLWKIPLATVALSAGLLKAGPILRRALAIKNPLKIAKEDGVQAFAARRRQIWQLSVVFFTFTSSFFYYVAKLRAEVDRQLEKYQGLLDGYVDFYMQREQGV
jgi:hypothetical protein